MRAVQKHGRDVCGLRVENLHCTARCRTNELPFLYDLCGIVAGRLEI
jgi:hypothetical protein